MAAQTINKWSVSWRNQKYDIYWDNNTTIHDFKTQLESLTGVRRSRIKLIGLKIKRALQKKIPRIQDDTHINHLHCRSKKGACLKMVGSMNKIFDFTESKYNTQFFNIIQQLFKMCGAKGTKHASRCLPNDITELIISYFQTQPFNFKRNNAARIASKTSADGLIVTLLNTAVNLGPIIDIQNMSHYECRLKILNMHNTAQIILGVRDIHYNYSRYSRNDNLLSDLSDLIYGNDTNELYLSRNYDLNDLNHGKSAIRIPTLAMCGSGASGTECLQWDEYCEFKPRWKAKKYYITLDELKRTESIYVRDDYDEDTLKEKDIIRVMINCMDQTVTTINENTGYKFTFKGITEDCVFTVWIRGAKVQILEQYSLVRSSNKM